MGTTDFVAFYHDVSGHLQEKNPKSGKTEAVKKPIPFFILVLLSLFLLTAMSGVVFASSGNWSEVTRFTGSGSETYTSDYFTCDHVEWRIRWDYVPDFQYPNLTSLSVFTYPTKEGDRGPMYVNFIRKTGNEDTSGTSYIHDYQGTFNMYIDVNGTESYTIIVEQDLISIPEFPSWIILPLFLVATLFVIVIRKRMFQGS